jgi:hypothetical protein
MRTMGSGHARAGLFYMQLNLHMITCSAQRFLCDVFSAVSNQGVVKQANYGGAADVPVYVLSQVCPAW